MRVTAAVAVVLAVLPAGLSGGRLDASTGPIPLKCDRACLERVVDQYLAAVVAHDPKHVPLSADVRYTENNQLLAVGDGFWKTAQGPGNYKHYFADPESGQVAFTGSWELGVGSYPIANSSAGTVKLVETILTPGIRDRSTSCGCIVAPAGSTIRRTIGVFTACCFASTTTPQWPSDRTTGVPGGNGATKDWKTSTTSGSKSNPLRETT